jgi:hypothetical protein
MSFARAMGSRGRLSRLRDYLAPIDVFPSLGNFPLGEIDQVSARLGMLRRALHEGGCLGSIRLPLAMPPKWHVARLSERVRRVFDFQTDPLPIPSPAMLGSYAG